MRFWFHCQNYFVLFFLVFLFFAFLLYFQRSFNVLFIYCSFLIFYFVSFYCCSSVYPSVSGGGDGGVGGGGCGAGGGSTGGGGYVSSIHQPIRNQKKRTNQKAGYKKNTRIDLIIPRVLLSVVVVQNVLQDSTLPRGHFVLLLQ